MNPPPTRRASGRGTCISGATRPRTDPWIEPTLTGLAQDRKADDVLTLHCVRLDWMAPWPCRRAAGAVENAVPVGPGRRHDWIRGVERDRLNIVRCLDAALSVFGTAPAAVRLGLPVCLLVGTYGDVSGVGTRLGRGTAPPPPPPPWLAPDERAALWGGTLVPLPTD
ncbi:hypothetical protein FQR65_LT20127 [Abscondita terminalis]|nr:hypothetical protein FQR65_LT20127 [Abscondita terminalis]